jgi:DNA-binding NarL/FixJ family response regulator
LETSTIRVLVVDGYEPWCRFVCSTLREQPEFRVVDTVSDGLEAVEKARQLQPDLVLLDIGLPTLNGIAVARRVRVVSPLSKILFVSLERSWDLAKEALRTGALGYIVKSDAARELLPAVRAVLQGRPFLSFSLTDLDSILSEKEYPASSAQREGVVVPPKTQAFRVNSREFRLYRDDAAFEDSFTHSVAAALEGGSEAYVVAAETDQAGILQKLSSDGADVRAAVARKRYVPLNVDSESTIMVDSATDWNEFANATHHAIEKALLTTTKGHLRAAVV